VAGHGRVPPVSIWQGDADTRVVPRNQQELVEQWTALHGISATPARSERSGRMTREFYIDGAGVTRVESVLVEGLAHAFSIRTGGTPSCGPAISWSRPRCVPRARSRGSGA
jgi:poly(3-hydroxybutyrate) depolymerase